MSEIVFKVVTISPYSNTLMSYNQNRITDKYNLTYKVGKVTKPTIPKSMLFAFLDLNEAKDLCDMILDKRCAIYEAETPYYITGILPQYLNDNIPEKFWATYEKPEDSHKNKSPFLEIMKFKSSVCCPELTLIKEVYKHV